MLLPDCRHAGHTREYGLTQLELAFPLVCVSRDDAWLGRVRNSYF